MSQNNIYVFDIDWSVNFPDRDRLLKFRKFPPLSNNVYLSTFFWPFSMQRPPKILATGRTKPIKAKILGFDPTSGCIGITLERYTTVEQNLRSYPFAQLSSSQFFLDFEIG
jgi:hypothetical protein